MTKITVTLPARLERYLERKAREGYDSPENFLLALVESCELQENRAADALELMKAPARTELESVLEKRSQGPFVPLREGWKQRVLQKASSRSSED
jgi:hypothetical protein